jgi:hypothetical protein
MKFSTAKIIPMTAIYSLTWMCHVVYELVILEKQNSKKEIYVLFSNFIGGCSESLCSWASEGRQVE